jgi:hypothetical protein
LGKRCRSNPSVRLRAGADGAGAGVFSGRLIFIFSGRQIAIFAGNLRPRDSEKAKKDLGAKEEEYVQDLWL